MSYAGIVRRCSVCQCCGMCDYEHEVVDIGIKSGDYNPLTYSLMKKTTKKQDDQLVTDFLISLENKEDKND